MLAEVINGTNLEDNQISFSSMGRVFFWMTELPNIFCSQANEESANANIPFCTWINALGQVKRSMQKLMVMGFV